MKIIGDYFNSLDDKQKRSAENFFIYKKYTTDANSPAAEYLFANFSKFDRNIRSDAAETARRLYHSEILKYLSGHIFVTKMYNPQAYEKLRQDIQDAGFDKVYPYQPVFGLIECYAKGDYNAYLDLLESTGDELAKTDFNLILLNLNRLIPVKSDEALKTRTSEYIRSVLHKLEPNTITLIGRVLTSIETE